MSDKNSRLELELLKKNLRKTTRQTATTATTRLQRPTDGIGVKIIKNIRCRKKDIKIKKLLPQSKNIEVSHRGRVVRRMTVILHAIFPASRLQREC